MIRDNPEAQEAFLSIIRQARIINEPLLQHLQKNYQHDLSIEELVSRYTKLIEESKDRQAMLAWQSRIAAANSVTVLVAADAFVHEKETLSGLCLQGAVLDRAKMKNIDCANALWIDSSFRSVNASGSNFEKAIMHKLDFGTSIREKIKNETVVNLSDLGHEQVMVETNKALYTWDHKKKSLKKNYVPLRNTMGEEIAVLQDITTIEKPFVAIDSQTKEYLWERPLSVKNMQYVEFSQNGNFLLAKSTLPNEFNKAKKGELYIIDLKSGDYHLFKDVWEYNEYKECKVSNLLFAMTWPTLRIIDMKSGQFHCFQNISDYQISKDGNFLIVQNTIDSGYRIIDIKEGTTLKDFADFREITKYVDLIKDDFKEISVSQFSPKDNVWDFKDYYFGKRIELIDPKTKKKHFFGEVSSHQLSKKGHFVIIKNPAGIKKYNNGFRLVHIGTETTVKSFDNLDEIKNWIECTKKDSSTLTAFENVSKDRFNKEYKNPRKGKRFMITHKSGNIPPDVLCTHPKTNVSIQQLQKSYFIGKLFSSSSKEVIADHVTQLSYRHPNMHCITHGMTKNTKYQVFPLTFSTLKPSIVAKGLTHIEFNEKGSPIGHITQEDTCVYEINKLPYRLPNRDTVCKVSSNSKYLGIKDTYKGTLTLYDTTQSDPYEPIKTLSDIVSFDLNNEYIAYTKQDKSFWIMPIGEEAKHITNNIDRCLLSPDGKHAFLIYNRHTVYIWDISSSSPVKAGAITPHEAPITAMNCIDNGRILVTASEDGVLQQWTLQGSNKQKSFLSYIDRKNPLADNIDYKYLEFSPITNFLCAKDCAKDKEGQLHIMNTEGYLHTFKKAYTFDVSPQGDLLVSSKQNKCYKLYIMDTEHVVYTFDEVETWCSSPSGDLLFVKNSNTHKSHLRIIDMQQKKVAHTFKGVYQWKVSKSGHFLFLKDYSEYARGTLRVIDTKSGQVMRVIKNVFHFEETEADTSLLVKDSEKNEKGQLRIIHTKNCQAFTIEGVGNYKAHIATARLFAKSVPTRQAGNLRIIDMESGKLLHAFENVTAFKVDPSGTFLLVKDSSILVQGNLRIINIKTGEVKKTLKDIGPFEISRSGRFFFVKKCLSWARGTLTIIDSQTFEPYGSFDDIERFEEIPSGGFLVTSDHRYHLSLIDVKEKRVVRELDNIYDFRIAPSGDFLIAKDKPFYLEQVSKLHIVNIKSGQLYTFDNVGAFTLSPSGDFLFAKDAKSNKKGCLRIILLPTGKILGTLPDIVHYTHLFTPSQPTLLSVIHSNGSLSLWEVHQDKVIQQWKTGVPEFALQTANFADVQGLSSSTIDMLSKYGAITNQLSKKKESTILDDLPRHLYNEDFSFTHTHIQKFLSWLHIEDFDGEALCLDVATTPQQSNVYHLYPGIYKSIANLIAHEYACTSTSTSKKTLTTQPQKTMKNLVVMGTLENYRKVLNSHKKRYEGKPHIDIANSYQNIAKVYEKYECYKEMLLNYRNALDILLDDRLIKEDL